MPVTTYKANDQVLVVKDSKFHKAGIILRVNNDRGDWLGCTYQGLGTMVEKDNVRVAIPSDPGYEATLEEWDDLRAGVISRLRRLSFALFLALMAAMGGLGAMIHQVYLS